MWLSKVKVGFYFLLNSQGHIIFVTCGSNAVFSGENVSLSLDKSLFALGFIIISDCLLW